LDRGAAAAVVMLTSVASFGSASAAGAD